MQIEQGLDQVAPHRAAQAAGGETDQRVAAARQHVVIQADLTNATDRVRLLDAAPSLYGLVVFAGDPARVTDPSQFEAALQRSHDVNYLGPILLAIFGSSRIVPRLPVIAERRKRLAIELACFFGGFGLSSLYFQLIVDHVASHDGIVPVIGFWGLIPIAVGLGLASAIERAARQSSTQMEA